MKKTMNLPASPFSRALQLLAVAALGFLMQKTLANNDALIDVSARVKAIESQLGRQDETLRAIQQNLSGGRWSGLPIETAPKL